MRGNAKKKEAIICYVMMLPVIRFLFSNKISIILSDYYYKMLKYSITLCKIKQKQTKKKSLKIKKEKSKNIQSIDIYY